MRLLLWTLFVALFVILSSCDAASVDENKVQRKLYTKVASEALAADNGFGHGKRALRVDNRNIAPNSVTEERAAAVSTGFGSKLLRSIKNKYLRWEQKKIVPSFQEKADKGMTYSKVRESQRTRLNGSGLWGTPSGFKRYARMYKTWLENNGYKHLAV